MRTSTYILPSVGVGIESATFNESCKLNSNLKSPKLIFDIDTAEQKHRFRSDPQYYREFRKAIEQQMNENFVSSIKNSSAQNEARQVCISPRISYHRPNY